MKIYGYPFRSTRNVILTSTIDDNGLNNRTTGDI